MKIAIRNAGAGFWLDAVAAVLALAGMVAAIVCSTISSDYALADLGLYIAGIIGALVLLALAVAEDAKHVRPLVSMVLAAVSVFLLARIALAIISSRILLISGLFTWASSNTVGWSVFTASVVATACLLASALLLVIACFLPVQKRA